MEILKILVIVVIVLGVGINGEEVNREGRCAKTGGRRNQNLKHKPHHMRKPYPLLRHDEHKFHGKKEFPPKVNAFEAQEAQASSFSHVTTHGKDEMKKPLNAKPVHPQETEDFNLHMFGDELVADPVEIPSTFGISPRLSISADGEITSFGRSMNFDKKRNFQDDDAAEYNHAHAHEHMDEDHDHFHKIRTARSVPSAGNKESGPQQLASALGQLQGANTAQGIDVHNGAHAGDYLLLNASGEQISASNQGSSSTSGSGTISSSGSTTVTTSGNSGWKH